MFPPFQPPPGTHVEVGDGPEVCVMQQVEASRCSEPVLTPSVAVSLRAQEALYPMGAFPRLGLCSSGKIFLILLGSGHFLGLGPSMGPPALAMPPPSVLRCLLSCSLCPFQSHLVSVCGWGRVGLFWTGGTGQKRE